MSWTLAFGMVVLITAGLVQVSAGAGLRDFDDGWLLQPDDQVNLLRGPDCSVFADQRTWWVQAGQMRLFGLPELPVVALGAAYIGALGGRTCLLAAGWQRTGRNWLQEDLMQVQVMVGRWRRLGLQARRRSLHYGNGSGLSATEVSLLLCLPVCLGTSGVSRFELTVPLTGAPDWFGTQGRRRLVRWVLQLPDVGLALDLDNRGDGRPSVTIDLFLALDRSLGFGLRADPATGQLGPTTTWHTGFLLIRSAHLIHGDLGLTHRVEVVFGRWGGY